MENPSNIIPDQLIVLEGDAGLVPKASSGDVGKVLGVLNSSGDVGWVPDQEGMAQVQSDWDQTDSSQVSYIANKPDLSVYATTSAMNTALAGKQDTISDLADIRSGAAKGDTAVQPAALNDYATTAAMNTALAGKQNTISDLDTIRAGAAAGATAAQPSDLPSSDELLPSATSVDSGKVLTVDAQGEPAWITPSGGSDVVTANGNFKLGGSVPVKVNYTGSQEYERGSLQLVNTFAAPGNYAVAVFEVVGAHRIDFDTYGSATVTINEAMDIAGSGNSDFAISFLQSDSNWYNNGQIYRESATVTDGKIVAQSLWFGSVSQYDTGPYLGVGVKVTNSPYESEKVAAVVQQLANGAVSISNWPKEQILATTIPNIPAATSSDANKVLTVDSNGDSVWQNIPAPSVDEVPAVTSSDDGKVLKASYSGGQGSYAWSTDGFTTTAGITDIQVVNSFPASPVSTVLYLIPEA